MNEPIVPLADTWFVAVVFVESQNASEVFVLLDVLFLALLGVVVLCVELIGVVFLEGHGLGQLLRNAQPVAPS